MSTMFLWWIFLSHLIAGLESLTVIVAVPFLSEVLSLRFQCLLFKCHKNIFLQVAIVFPGCARYLSHFHDEFQNQAVLKCM